MSNAKKVTVLYVPVGEVPRAIETDGSLEGYQQLVGGYIETMHPFEDAEVTLVCNEEGKLIPLAPNRVLRDARDPERIIDIVCGSFFLAYSPADAEEFESLPEELAEKYAERFHTPELITQPVRGKILVLPLDTERS